MAMTIGEVRKRRTKFAFTVQLDDQIKPLDVVCDTKEMAHRRIEALKEADCAWAEALGELPLH